MPTRTLLTAFTIRLAVFLACGSAARAAFVTGQEADRFLGNQVNSRFGFFNPAAVAIDPVTKKVFVAEQFGNRVVRFGSMESLLNGAQAEAAFGQPNLDARHFGAGPDRMEQPQGVWVDGGGRLWVADSENHRVLRFDNASTAPSGSHAVVVLGQANFTNITSATAQNRLSYPVGICIDALGRLWVADRSNNRVMRFDNAASKATGANADGVIGQALYTTSTGGSGAANLSVPTSVATFGTDGSGDAIALWIGESSNRRVVRLAGVSFKAAMGASADGVLGINTFAAAPGGLGSGQFGSVTGMAVDSAGNLYVSDQIQSRVQRFDSARTKANGAAANGVLGQAGYFVQVNGFAMNGMWGPMGLATDGARLWAVDGANSRVLRFDSASLKANGAAAESMLGKKVVTDPAAVNEFMLNKPRGIAIDPTTGKLFCSDTENNRVLRYASAVALQSGAPAEAVLGQPDFNSATLATTQAGMSKPSGLTVDSAGRLWVADWQNSRVLRFDNASTLSNGTLASGVLGQPDYTTAGGTFSNTKLNSPQGVAVDSAGRLYVADTGGHRVMRWDAAATKAPGTVANGVLGQATFFTGLGAGGIAGMNAPIGIATDGAGRIFVAEALNHRVLRFDAPAALVTGGLPDAVYGQPDFTTNTLATSASKFNSPQSVALDSTGRLFVSEFSNHRVLWFNKVLTKPVMGASADGVLGQEDFADPVGALSVTGFIQPMGLALDSDGNLWVADSFNNRAVRFSKHAQEVTTYGLAPNGHFSLVFASQSGRTYQILSSPNLTSWSLATTVSATSFITQWIDSNPKVNRMYYKVVEP